MSDAYNHASKAMSEYEKMLNAIENSDEVSDEVFDLVEDNHRAIDNATGAVMREVR